MGRKVVGYTRTAVKKREEEEERTPRAIGYVRVSKEEQAKKGLSLENQEEMVEAYAKVRNMELVDLIRDEGRSASNLDREGIESIVKMARAGEIDAVIVYRLDRFSRSTQQTLNILKDVFEANDVEFLSVHENLDTSTAAGRFFLKMISALAEYERELLQSRITDVLHMKKQRGERLGTTPLGFVTVKNPKNPDGPGVLKPRTDELRVIAGIKHLRDDGWSLGAICNHLANLGIKTKRGKQWHASTVRYILNNPRYENVEPQPLEI